MAPEVSAPRPESLLASRGARAALIFVVALVARVVVVGLAAARFPPSADGTYYHTFADRLARGLGYTWAWPDGAVTYASHYPVGYPALLAPAYRLFGSHASVAMGVNALLGAFLALCMFMLLERATSPGWALAGGLVIALHPALVPYTAALMTEGATCALLAMACALGSASASSRGPLGVRGLSKAAFVASGIVLGVAVLVRPQCLVLAPAFGAVFVRRAGTFPRLGAGALMTVLALAVCAPWTYRNCVRMKSCALVSVNGGWNLLIGEQTRTGAWEAVDVPTECRTVWDEAKKDTCFGAAARKNIERSPAAWMTKMPKKLAVTFDYFGGAPWYLHQANPEAFTYDAKVRLGTLETVVSRLLLAMAVVALARAKGAFPKARKGLGALGLLSALTLHAWPAYLGLGLLGALLGPRALVRGPVLVPVSLAVVLSTAAMHAAFFGAGRYGLVTAPFVAALAFVRPRGR